MTQNGPLAPPPQKKNSHLYIYVLLQEKLVFDLKKKYLAAWTGGITLPSKWLAATWNDPTLILWRVQNYFSPPPPRVQTSNAGMGKFSRNPGTTSKF